MPIADHVARYALSLARLTRRNEPDAPQFIKDYVLWGAGPRASQYLVLGAKAHAVLMGRFFATHEDIQAIAAPVLRHRIKTNFNADAEGITPDELIRRLTADGALDANARVPFSPAPLRVGVITSVGSAAWADFQHEIERSGLGFRLAVVDVRVQGETTPRLSSIALDAKSASMCARFEVPVSGSMPSAVTKRKTTAGTVAFTRRAMASTSGRSSSRALAVSSEKPW